MESFEGTLLWTTFGNSVLKASRRPLDWHALFVSRKVETADYLNFFRDIGYRRRQLILCRFGRAGALYWTIHYGPYVAKPIMRTAG